MPYTDQVTVLRGHLEEVYRAVDNAYGYHMADDLARQYKNTGGVHKPSNLTKVLSKATEHLEGYLQKEGEDVPEE